MHFLKYGRCEKQLKGDSYSSPCTYIHYFERIRDKVIQDDDEYSVFVSQQDNLASEFCFAAGISLERSELL